MSQKILTIIPARANSKRLPKKNKRLFFGKPLIEWTIDAALAVKHPTTVVVTTDDNEILNYKSKYPHVVFIKRPDELCTDTATSMDVIFHALKSMPEAYEQVLLLQPTSPLRGTHHINAVVDLAYKSKIKQVVSVKKLSDNVKYIIAEGDQGNTFLHNFINEKYLQTNQFKVLNGAIYFSDAATLFDKKSFINSDTYYYEMSEFDSVDIDTELDWLRAECFFSARSQS